MYSTIYHLDGTHEVIQHDYYGKTYFQKNLDITKTNHQVELKVAQKLFLQPMTNVVKVLDIIYSYPVHIKYELLDVTREQPPLAEIAPQIIQGMNNLHNIRCIYIDFKDDNIGYSLRDKSWKIFDFDCSGFCSPDYQRWIIPPPAFFRWRDVSSMILNLDTFIQNTKLQIKPESLKKIRKIIERKDLIKYDELAFYLEYGKLPYLGLKY